MIVIPSGTPNRMSMYGPEARLGRVDHLRHDVDQPERHTEPHRDRADRHQRDHRDAEEEARGPRAAAQPATRSRTSASTSKLAWTLSTSSLSSRASMSLSTLTAASSSSGTRHLRQLGDLGGLDLDAGLVERGAHGGQRRRLAEDLEHVVVRRDVLGAGVDGDHQVVLGVALAVDDDQAALVEEVGDRAGLAEAAAVLGEHVADLGAGAVAVVGDRLDRAAPRRRGRSPRRRPPRARRRRRPHRCPWRSRARCCPWASRRPWPSARRDRGLALVSGSPPPSFAATVIARASFVNSLPRRESTIAFLCLIPAHLECAGHGHTSVDATDSSRCGAAVGVERLRRGRGSARPSPDRGRGRAPPAAPTRGSSPSNRTPDAVGVADDLGDALAVGPDHRRPARERLGEHEPERLAPARQRADPRRAVERGQVGHVDELDALGPAKAPAVRASSSSRAAGVLAADPRQRLDQQPHALARLARVRRADDRRRLAARARRA